MGMYTRANVQLRSTNPDVDIFEESAIHELLEWLYEAARVWTAIHVIPMPTSRCLELRFSSKRRSGEYMEPLANRGFEVWSITNFECAGTDRMEVYTPNSTLHPNNTDWPDHSYFTFYAFDEIEVTTENPADLIPKLGENCSFEELETGVLIKDSGVYQAATFLYYHSESQTRVVFFDEGYEHDLEKIHGEDNFIISDLKMSEHNPFIEEFVKNVTDDYSKTAQYSDIKQIEFRFKNQNTHRFFESEVEGFWCHICHDGFSNCVTQAYLDYQHKNKV